MVEMRGKKYVALLIMVALVLGAFAGCSSEPAEAETVKIGLIAPTTGQVAVYGQAVQNAVEQAVEEQNAAGGLLGKQIELVAYDNKGDATESVNAFNRLVDNDNIDAFIGCVISSTTLTVAPLAVDAGMPMITPTGTNLEITPIGDNIFRACFIDPYQGKVIGQFALNELGAKKAAVMFNTADDYSVGLKDAFVSAFEAAGGEIVAVEGYTGGTDKDFKAQLTNVDAAGPDVLFLPDYYNTVGLIADQAVEVGIDATLIGADGWDGVLGVSPESVEGAYFANHYAKDDPDEQVQAFIADYTAKYEEAPNALAALGYDAAYIMFQAIEKAGSVDKAAIIDAMGQTEIDGVTGHIVFDADGNPEKSISIIRVENGVDVLYGKFGAQ
jgi:branched-chain amino acid transport system substrate-binding protein